MKPIGTAPLIEEKTHSLFYLALLIVLTWIIYTPGLSGDFLFDDFSSLSQLGDYGTVDNLESLWLYLLGNSSGPTGRPISMLSFLLDARSWPADPETFKHTNVLIHLLNGLVLFALIQKISQALGHNNSTAKPVALLTTAMWLLHPFWVSTTLYAVQRMTQLSTLFVLLALLLYTITRLKYPPRLSSGMVVGTGSAILIMGPLAILSKENGALLPLLVITLEMTALKVYDQTRGQAGSSGFRCWRLLLLGLPTLLLFAYLSMQLPPLLEGNSGTRDFTPGERFLTQSRILWDYLFHIILPRPYTGGLFNDDIILSTSLFNPWYTIIAWAAWLIIFIWALINRTKRPAISLAILFFLSGHLLESSFIQLELYFEHRNYLPATLLGFPIALWWMTRPIQTSIRNLAIFGLLAILALLTALRADLWGQPFLQAVSWAQVNPGSPRAQVYLAEQWRNADNWTEAARLNARAIKLSPNSITALGQNVSLNCQFGKNAKQAISNFTQALENKNAISTVDKYHLAKTLDFLIGKSCGDSSNPENILAMLKSIQESNHGQRDKMLGTILAQRMGIVLLQQNKPMEAKNSFHRSTRLTPDPGIVLKNAALLATHKAYGKALEYLDTTDLQEQVPNSWGISKMRYLYIVNSDYYQREKDHLREQIAKDALLENRQPTTNME